MNVGTRTDKKTQLEILKYYRSGYTNKQNSKKFKLNINTIAKILKINGVVRINKREFYEKMILWDIHNIPTTDIIKKYGVSRSFVLNIAREHGAKCIRNYRKIKLNDLEIKHLVDDYKNRKTIPYITNKYKIDVVTMYRMLKREGVKLLGSNNKKGIRRFNKEEQDNIIRDYDAGFGIQDLCSKYITGQGTIRNVLKSNNIFITRKHNKTFKYKGETRYDR